MTAQPAEVLPHELLMHQIELKMQNEVLHRRKSPPSRIVTLSAIAVNAGSQFKLTDGQAIMESTIKKLKSVRGEPVEPPVLLKKTP